MLRAIVDAGKAEFAFAIDLQAVISEREVSSRTDFCAGSALYAL